MIKFGSVCSGIEAASVAWMPLGWMPAWFSEIEPFPSALLEHHYPEVPNLGDMTNLPDLILNGEVEAPDVFCGGTPCQAFSVAGKRQSLDDERGNLSLTFCEIANAIDDIRHTQGKQPSIIFWENVPGVLNTKDNAFGCFLGKLAGEDCALEPAGGRWTNAGFVLGPKRAIAWRILDAQYFGVAQRRRRVFVVASSRDGFDAAQVLFEFDGVRRDIAPSREQGQKTAGDAGAGFTSSGFGGYKRGSGTLRANGGDLGGGSETLIAKQWPAEVASTLNASFGSKLGLENQHIDGGAPLFVPAKAYGVPGNWIGRKPENGGNSTQFMHEVAPAQTATDKHGVIAFNSRQDPVSGDVAGALDTCSPQAQAIAIQGSMIGRKPENGPQGAGYDETGVCFTQTAVDQHAVAVVYPINTMTMLGRPSDDLKPRMGLGIGGQHDPQNTLSAAHCHAVATQTAVRRLTPVECERLQGFPDNYTQIPWRNKSPEDCPDGHRYKALGNSWAVPVVRWIGKRIQKELSK